MVYLTFLVEQLFRQMMCIICLVNPIAGFTQLTLLFLQEGAYIKNTLNWRGLPIYCIVISAMFYFVIYYLMERETSSQSTKQRASRILSMRSATVDLPELSDSSLQASLNNQSHILNPNTLLRIRELTLPTSQASSRQVSN